MSETVKTIFKWLGYLFLAIAGGAGGGAAMTAML